MLPRARCRLGNPDPEPGQFHNGEGLTSEAVKVTFQRLMDPATRSPWKPIFSVIKVPDTPDPQTVVFRFDLPPLRAAA